MKNKYDYAEMQKSYYDDRFNDMFENHRRHDKNPDYTNILLSSLTKTPNLFKNEYGLDFGCGQGRNVSNLINLYPDLFKRVDGVDISEKNIEMCYVNLNKEVKDKNKYSFFVNNGVDISVIDNNVYMFVMSTIVLQHICVYENRYSLMSEIFRILKNNGVFSFQMGFGNGHPKTANYFDNVYDATTTNSGYDVKILDENNLINDLNKIGFKDINITISNSDYDLHEKWIYVNCVK